MEVWYLFGAWALAAAMNAMLTWWAWQSRSWLHFDGRGDRSRDILLKVVPVFVAILVWLVPPADHRDLLDGRRPAVLDGR